MGFSPNPRVPQRAAAEPVAAPDAALEATTHGRVLAVVVQRTDHTCGLFCRGWGGDWPALGDAQGALEQMVGSVVWREATPGVWVARSNVDRAPVPERRAKRPRRVEVTRSSRSVSDNDTYETARILRGIIRPSRSR